MISVRHSKDLLSHLSSFEVDGATVASALFDGGRLSYPERRRMEHELSFTEPYQLEHEARVMLGMSSQWNAACRFLAKLATRKFSDSDPTLELLWTAHDAFAHLTKEAGPPSLDRLVAALVIVHDARKHDLVASVLFQACEVVVLGLQSEGFPPSGASLEEICDGALPACVGLGMVDIDWRAP